MNDKNPQFDLFDVCSSRHRGNVQSVEANPASVDKLRDRTIILGLIRNARGITSKEIAEAMGRPLNCISGRISELKTDQKIATRGSRDGCSILYAR